MQTRPIPAITPKDRGPVDGVEINIVFTHELVEADVFRVHPPLFPFRRIAGGDAWVSNTSVELVHGDVICHSSPRR